MSLSGKPAPVDPGQLRKLREERAKLTANWLNGISLAFAVVGVVQPPANGGSALVGALFLAASAFLHYLARRVLRWLFPLE